MTVATLHPLQPFVDEFRSLTADERLEALLELSDDLPPLSRDRAATPPAAECRVHECQTPIDLWVDVRDGRVYLEALVPRTSAVVRGILAMLVQSLNGCTIEQVRQLPHDLIQQLGLETSLGMTRQRGFEGVLSHIRRHLPS